MRNIALYSVGNLYTSFIYVLFFLGICFGQLFQKKTKSRMYYLINWIFGEKIIQRRKKFQEETIKLFIQYDGFLIYLTPMMIF